MSNSLGLGISIHVALEIAEELKGSARERLGALPQDKAIAYQRVTDQVDRLAIVLLMSILLLQR